MSRLLTVFFHIPFIPCELVMDKPTRNVPRGPCLRLPLRTLDYALKDQP